MKTTEFEFLLFFLRVNLVLATSIGFKPFNIKVNPIFTYLKINEKNKKRRINKISNI